LNRRKTAPSRGQPPPRSLPLRWHGRSLTEQIAGTLLLAAAVLGAFCEFIPLPDATDRIEGLPQQGYGFASREMALDDTERAVFGEARVLKRSYQVGPYSFLLEAIDASPNRHSVPDPLFRFRGVGWNLVEDREIPVPGGVARHVTLHNPGKSTEALVWYSDAHSRHASTTRHWWQSVSRRLTFGASGPQPILVILQPISDAPIPWDDLFARFPALFEI
jgi:hypothetical protein